MPERKIVTKLSELPRLTDCASLILDVETTSFNDEEPAFHPFNGHRVAGYGLMTLDGHAWYLPVRHRPANEGLNLPFEGAIKWLRETLGSRPDLHLIGHNVKFDLRFAAQDGIFPSGTLEDTVTLFRLVDAMSFSADLNAVAKAYLGVSGNPYEADVRQFLHAARSKDYGVVPPDKLGPYCLEDLDLTRRVREVLQKQLPEGSARLWQIEQRLTKVLLDSELRGVNVPLIPLKKYAHKVIKSYMQSLDAIHHLCGQELDVNSNKQLTEILRDKMCIQPMNWTKNGQPSWDGETLRQYGMKLTDLVADAKEYSAQAAAFAQGWLSRLAPDETLHPTFKQYGAKSGRLASEDPNFQNLNDEAKCQVVPRPGYSFLSLDMSQIEFRLFGHYSQSDYIINKYNEDDRTDFHLMMADTLGIPRKPAKTINFAFLFGMGREKTEASITSFVKSALLTIAEPFDPADSKATKALEEAKRTLEQLRQFNFGEAVDARNAHRISASVYNTVHRRFPAIRGFADRVRAALRQRGFVRNLYGRVYKSPPELVEKLAHKFRNYVIQGSAADLLKDRMCELPPVLQRFNAFLLANVHDEVLIETPKGSEIECADAVIPVLESPSVEIKVPIRVECSVCVNSWGEKVSLKEFRDADNAKT